jgi:hypothetical protein
LPGRHSVTPWKAVALASPVVPGVLPTLLGTICRLVGSDTEPSVAGVDDQHEIESDHRPGKVDAVNAGNHLASLRQLELPPDLFRAHVGLSHHEARLNSRLGERHCLAELGHGQPDRSGVEL